MDEIDLANAHEELFRENALKGHFARLKKDAESRTVWMPPGSTGPAGGESGCDNQAEIRYCLDCKNEIDPRRIAIFPGAVRCTPCQTKKERLDG